MTAIISSKSLARHSVWAGVIFVMMAGVVAPANAQAPYPRTCPQGADLEERIACLEENSVFKDELEDELRPINNRLNEQAEQAAISNALEDPDLVGAENFGLRMNWGGIEGENALGLSAAAVLGRNVLGHNDRLAVSGAVGLGLQHDQVGGRVGAQLTWK